MKRYFVLAAVIVLAVIGLGLFISMDGSETQSVIMLATTTSTDDSGLLKELLPIFEQESGYEVQVIAVGTGQAMKIGRMGDADILMVHARELENQFVNDGYGTERYSLMYNDFVLLGPVTDPAQVKSTETIKEALQAIESNKAMFASRGDESGTHLKEESLWDEAEIDVSGTDWYKSLGQGMGETLITANEMQTYTIADRGTYLSMKHNLPNLEIVFEGDESLFNPYGIIPVNPDRFDRINHEGAKEMVEFFVREDIQEKIGEFGKDEYGQPLFFPDADTPDESTDNGMNPVAVSVPIL